MLTATAHFGDGRTEEIQGRTWGEVNDEAERRGALWYKEHGMLVGATVLKIGGEWFTL